MSEEKKDEGTMENTEGKEVVEVKENLRARIRRKAGQFWKDNRMIFAMLFVGVMGFMIGRTFWVFQSFARFAMNGFQSSEEPRKPRKPRACGPDGCSLYPNEPICKAPRGDRDVSDCFIPQGSQAPKPEDLYSIPYECRQLGPMGLLDVEDLRKETSNVPKPVTEVPPRFKPYFESAQTQLSVKSAMITLLIVAKANGEDAEDAMKDPVLGPMIRDMSLASDDGLTEEERKSVGQMLSIYNAFTVLAADQRAELREKIAKECAGYADKELVPIRCAFIGHSPATPPSAPTPL